MARTVILGIDGLDADVIAANLRVLPAIESIVARGAMCRVQSVFPPDSDTAWATLYTGLSPANHGILHMEHPLEKTARLASQKQDNSRIRGRTFWDDASRAGLKCGIIFPHLGYPAWPINGLMIGRAGTRRGFSVEGRLPSPHVLKEEHQPMTGFPRRGKEDKFLAEAVRRINAETELFCELLSSEDWDLFYAYSSTLDLIEHFLWPSPHSANADNVGDRIRAVYREYDRMIGSLTARLGPDDRILIVSDHGHGPRPEFEFRLLAYLATSLEGQTPTLYRRPRLRAKFARLLRQVPTSVLMGVNARIDIRNLVHQAFRLVPPLGAVASSLDSLDGGGPWSLVLGSSVKAYSYGGIRIRISPHRATDENIIPRIVDALAKARDQRGLPIVKWVCGRNELDSGPYESVLPDILFELNEEFAATGRFGEPFVTAYRGNDIVPGSHRICSAVFLSNHSELRQGDLGLCDVHRRIRSELRLRATECSGSPLRAAL